MTNIERGHLTIVTRNPSPNCEPQHPATWLLQAHGRDTIKVRVDYDAARRPHIVSRDAA
jgi:hypothetical protein